MNNVLSEVHDALKGAARELTAEACLSKFPEGIGERNKELAVERICRGKMELPPCDWQSMPDPKAAFELRLMGRMLVNHAGGVLENANICLHRHYGCPYIPGSALKGVARHAAWCAWKDAPDEEKTDAAFMLGDLFGIPTGDKGLDNYLKKNDEWDGKTHYEGSVVFLPAYPVELPKKCLEPDIVNSHQRSNLNPVYFPAVAPGLVFRFVVGKARKPSAFEDAAPELAAGFLRDGLTKHGVGAKTGSGYGFFEEVV